MKPGPFDITARVEVVATEKHPTRKAGKVHKVGLILAEHLRKKGFVK